MIRYWAPDFYFIFRSMKNLFSGIRAIFTVFSLLLVHTSVIAYSPTADDANLLSKLTYTLDELYQNNTTKFTTIAQRLPDLKLRFTADTQGYYILDQLHTHIQLKDRPTADYKILKIVDGDTVDIAYSGTVQRVRLIGLDAPESTTTRYGYLECFGRESSAHLAQLLSWKNVSIEFDSSQWEHDKYNRLLAYLSSDGSNINQKMIADGYWREYTYDKPYKYVNDFKQAQTSAMNNWSGLRANDACAGERKKDDSSTGTNSGTNAMTNTNAPINTSSRPNGAYSCSVPKTCSAMSSCEEAKYYLHTCGVHSLDSDGDQTPCESLCG